MLPLCVTMLIFHNRTSAKNPDFCQKSAQNTEIFPQKTFFTFIPFYFAFRPPPQRHPPPQVCQSGQTIRGNYEITTFFI